MLAMNGCDSIVITQSAQDDLLAGFWFYEQQQSGLGSYFLSNLMADIDDLKISAGVHVSDKGVFRSLAKKFPYAIYYLQSGEEVTLVAVLDSRRSPSWITSRLG